MAVEDEKRVVGPSDPTPAVAEGPPTFTQGTNDPLLLPLGPDEVAVIGRIGPYRILRLIGQGGMGIVYEAEQESPVRRRVALKLTQPGMDTREVIVRFESERQALALMTHPNIAAVYDAGATPSGRPYFVMEFVAGVPLTDFCDRGRLTVEQRLRLFAQVCDGVQHAHHRGVIHRDIKSTNILVALQEEKPVPKLIDFGIAKATGRSLTDETLKTVLGQLVGTPAYMSPEQADLTGLDVDTRTDVYSLGVVLYELLVGVRPFEPREGRVQSLDDIRRRIREEEPLRPSDRLTALGDRAARIAQDRRSDPASLRRQIRGDLDWIALKAMEKDRGRRYSTPAELAADVFRHLAFQPVIAGPPGVTYRLRKFLRRHRLGVTAAALMAAALVGGTVLATYGLVRARRAESAALREGARAQAINQFLQQTLGSAHPSEGKGREMTVVETLGNAVQKIDSSFPDQPDIRAALRQTIGRTYADLGLYAEAEPLLTASLEARRQLLGPESLEVAESLNSVGALAFDKGDLATAEARFREALAIRRRVAGDDSLPVAESLNDVALALEEGKSDYEGAEPLLQQALALRRRILGDRHRDVAQSLNNLAMLYYRKRNYDRAEPLFREALALNRELLGNEHLEVSTGLNNLALLLRDKGDYDQAAESFRQVMALDRKRLGAQHPTVASTMNSLGAVLTRSGRYAEAEALFREALEIQARTFPEGHWQLATTRSLLGGCLTGAGRYREAEPLLLTSFATIRGQFGDDHARTRASRGRVAALYEASGQPEKASRYKAP